MSSNDHILFIAGGGFFGSKALHEASRRFKVVIADISEHCLARSLVDVIVRIESLDEKVLERHTSILIIGDSAEVLSRVIRLGFTPGIVVPTVPRHFAADFYKHELEIMGFRLGASTGALKKALMSFPKELILNVNFDEALFTFSYMPSWSRCILPCAQPDTCPVTGRFKPKPMMQVIDECIKMFDESLVLRSMKIGDIIGGFEFNTLWRFINESIEKALNKEINVALATACRCHGVANFFRVSRG
ncbi:MAG: hypothetical protein ACXQTI_06885 [Candidatus Nezhaarchaeales archaeon]